MWIIIKQLTIRELMIYLGPLGPGPVFMRFRPRISADMNIYIVDILIFKAYSIVSFGEDYAIFLLEI